MPSLFTELRRRNVFKVGAAYAIVAWLLIEVSSVLLPTFNAPEWIMQVFTLFVILGFPLALILAWAFDLTPQGIKAASDVHSGSAPPQIAGQRLSYVFQGLVLLAVGFLVMDQYLLEPQARLNVVTEGASVSSVPESTSPLAAGVVQRTYIDLGPTEQMSSGLNAMIALSPDGRQLVYVARKESATRLYRRPMNEFESYLIAEGELNISNPFFSPDGEWIGFVSPNGELKKISLVGGPVQTLAAPGGGGLIVSGSWSSDDTIYTTDVASNSLGLSQVSAAGGRLEALTVPEPGEQHLHPWALPDGSAVLFTIRLANQSANEGHIAVLSLESGEYKTIIESAYGGRYVPTGHILFSREGSLWAVPFDLKTLETEGPEAPVVEGVQMDGSNGVSAYAVSTDGTLIYLPGSDTSGSVEWSLVWVERDGREEALLVEPGFYSLPVISPDSSRLAVQAAEAGNEDIWIHDLQRGTSTRLTFSLEDDVYPLWTPDSERVVFWSDREGGGLFWKSADGTGPTERLTTNQARQFPESFSPDGQMLVYAQDVAGTISNLYVLLMEGGSGPQPLLTNDWDEDFADISPDGRWIAYEGNDLGYQSHIFVRPFPNVEDGRWQISTEAAAAPIWGPDGQELFYRHLGSSELLVATIETDFGFSSSTPRSVIGGSYDSRKGSMDVSPDGERFLVLKNLGASQEQSAQTRIIVVNNWFEELNRLAPPSP